MQLVQKPSLPLACTVFFLTAESIVSAFGFMRPYNLYFNDCLAHQRGVGLLTCPLTGAPASAINIILIILCERTILLTFPRASCVVNRWPPQQATAAWFSFCQVFPLVPPTLPAPRYECRQVRREGARTTRIFLYE